MEVDEAMIFRQRKQDLIQFEDESFYNLLFGKSFSDDCKIINPVNPNICSIDSESCPNTNNTNDQKHPKIRPNDVIIQEGKQNNSRMKSILKILIHCKKVDRKSDNKEKRIRFRKYLDSLLVDVREFESTKQEQIKEYSQIQEFQEHLQD